MFKPPTSAEPRKERKNKTKPASLPIAFPQESQFCVLNMHLLLQGSPHTLRLALKPPNAPNFWLYVKLDPCAWRGGARPGSRVTGGD